MDNDEKRCCNRGNCPSYKKRQAKEEAEQARLRREYDEVQASQAHAASASPRSPPQPSFGRSQSPEQLPISEYEIFYDCISDHDFPHEGRQITKNNLTSNSHTPRIYKRVSGGKSLNGCLNNNMNNMYTFSEYDRDAPNTQRVSRRKYRSRFAENDNCCEDSTEKQNENKCFRKCKCSINANIDKDRRNITSEVNIDSNTMQVDPIEFVVPLNIRLQLPYPLTTSALPPPQSTGQCYQVPQQSAIVNVPLISCLEPIRTSAIGRTPSPDLQTPQSNLFPLTSHMPPPANVQFQTNLPFPTATPTSQQSSAAANCCPMEPTLDTPSTSTQGPKCVCPKVEKQQRSPYEQFNQMGQSATAMGTPMYPMGYQQQQMGNPLYEMGYGGPVPLQMGRGICNYELCKPPIDLSLKGSPATPISKAINKDQKEENRKNIENIKDKDSDEYSRDKKSSRKSAERKNRKNYRSDKRDDSSDTEKREKRRRRRSSDEDSAPKSRSRRHKSRRSDEYANERDKSKQDRREREERDERKERKERRKLKMDREESKSRAHKESSRNRERKRLYATEKTESDAIMSQVTQGREEQSAKQETRNSNEERQSERKPSEILRRSTVSLQKNRLAKNWDDDVDSFFGYSEKKKKH